MRGALYLCGFMGCGKTTVGRIAAEGLNLTFCDLDEHIEAYVGRSISDIVKADGIDRFRDLESELLGSVFSKSRAIVALGGGAVLRRENVALIKKRGILVFIDTDFSVCRERIKDDNNRPLAYEKTIDELEKLYNERKRIYLDNADYTVNGNTSVQALSEGIISIYNDYIQR